uniref:LDL receptor related protein 10 n=1 Tax=Callithrix jacchus TaxID=9483 RepID=A0A8I3W187_CALJA
MLSATLLLLLLLGGALAHADRIIFPNPACEDPPAVLLEVQGTLQRPLVRDSRTSPANCTWLILGSKEQTVTIRFQKLHLACGSERLTLRSPLQPLISLCEAPPSPLQLPGGNVTITYSYAGARAPMGQGFLLSYSQDWLMCLQEEFQCLNHRCVSALQRCDGIDACGDGSDEAGHHSSSHWQSSVWPAPGHRPGLHLQALCHSHPGVQGQVQILKAVSREEGPQMTFGKAMAQLQPAWPSIFAPLSRMEAEIVQQQAPPSYGQLIAQGAIPPVEDFPTENPNDNSVLGNLRSLLQILRQDMTPGGASGARRRQRGRLMRRLVRRLRRWGFLPRTSTPARASEARSQVTPSAAPLESLDGGTGPGHEGGAVGGQDGEQAPPLPIKAPLPSASTSPAPATVPEAPGPLPSLPLEPSLLSGVVQALRGRLLPSLGPPGPTRSPPGPHTAVLAPEDEDDVLLVPLAEPGVWVVEAEDEPLLT